MHLYRTTLSGPYSIPMETRAHTKGGREAGKRNRAALIAAARTVFEERGVNAPLYAVAKLAGVGQGSLYRHFPDRISLAVAVFEENVREIEELGADPEATLSDVVDLVSHHTAAGAAFIETITVSKADARVEDFDRRLRAVLEIKRGQAAQAGITVSGTSVDDLMLAVRMVAMSVSHSPHAERQVVAKRAWELLAPGLGQAVRPKASGSD